VPQNDLATHSLKGEEIERSMVVSRKRGFIPTRATRSHVEENGFILSLEPDVETINGLAALFPAIGN
jgi:hypothetical protein